MPTNFGDVKFAYPKIFLSIFVAVVKPRQWQIDKCWEEAREKLPEQTVVVEVVSLLLLVLCLENKTNVCIFQSKSR